MAVPPSPPSALDLRALQRLLLEDLPNVILRDIIEHADARNRIRLAAASEDVGGGLSPVVSITPPNKPVAIPTFTALPMRQWIAVLERITARPNLSPSSPSRSCTDAYCASQKDNSNINDKVHNNNMNANSSSVHTQRCDEVHQGRALGCVYDLLDGAMQGWLREQSNGADGAKGAGADTALPMASGAGDETPRLTPRTPQVVGSSAHKGNPLITSLPTLDGCDSNSFMLPGRGDASSTQTIPLLSLGHADGVPLLGGGELGAECLSSARLLRGLLSDNGVLPHQQEGHAANVSAPSILMAAVLRMGVWLRESCLCHSELSSHGDSAMAPPHEGGVPADGPTTVGRQWCLRMAVSRGVRNRHLLLMLGGWQGSLAAPSMGTELPPSASGGGFPRPSSVAVLPSGLRRAMRAVACHVLSVAAHHSTAGGVPLGALDEMAAIEPHAVLGTLGNHVLKSCCPHPLLMMLSAPPSYASRDGSSGRLFSFYDNFRVSTINIVFQELIKKGALRLYRQEGIRCTFYEERRGAHSHNQREGGGLDYDDGEGAEGGHLPRYSKGRRYVRKLRMIQQAEDDLRFNSNRPHDPHQPRPHYARFDWGCSDDDDDDEADEDQHALAAASHISSRISRRFNGVSYDLVTKAFAVHSIVQRGAGAQRAVGPHQQFLLSPLVEGDGGDARPVPTHAITMQSDGVVSGFYSLSIASAEQVREGEEALPFVKWEPFVIISPKVAGGAHGSRRDADGGEEGRVLDALRAGEDTAKVDGAQGATPPVAAAAGPITTNTVGGTTPLSSNHRPTSTPVRQPSPDSLLKAAMRVGRQLRGGRAHASGADGTTPQRPGARGGNLFGSNGDDSAGRGGRAVPTSALLLASSSFGSMRSFHPWLDAWGHGPSVVSGYIPLSNQCDAGGGGDPYFTNALAAMGSGVSDKKERGRAAAAQRLLRQHQKQLDTAAKAQLAVASGPSSTRGRRRGPQATPAPTGGVNAAAEEGCAPSVLTGAAVDAPRMQLQQAEASGLLSREGDGRFSGGITSPIQPTVQPQKSLSPLQGPPLISPQPDASTPSTTAQLPTGASTRPHGHTIRVQMGSAVMTSLDTLADLLLFVACSGRQRRDPPSPRGGVVVGGGGEGGAVRTLMACLLLVAGARRIVGAFPMPITAGDRSATVVTRRRGVTGDGLGSSPLLLATGLGNTVALSAPPLRTLRASLVEAAGSHAWGLTWSILASSALGLADGLERHVGTAGDSLLGQPLSSSSLILEPLRRDAFIAMTMFSVAVVPLGGPPSPGGGGRGGGAATLPMLIALPYCAAMMTSIAEVADATRVLTAAASAVPSFALGAYEVFGAVGSLLLHKLWPPTYRPSAAMLRGEGAAPDAGGRAVLSLRGAAAARAVVGARKRGRSPVDGGDDDGKVCESTGSDVLTRTTAVVFVSREIAALRLFADLLLRQRRHGMEGL